MLYMLPSRFLFSIMHFLMAKLHVIIESGCQASIALCTVYAAALTHRRHTRKQPYKYTRWLMSDGAQIPE